MRLGEDGEITHVEPYPRQRAYTVSNNDTSQQRHWLTEEEWAKVSELLKSCPASEKHEQPRIGRALFYFEKTAYEYHFADRWELLVRTAEILWGREFEEDKVVDQGKIKAAGKSSGKRKQGRGARFRIGLRCLANEFNIDVLEEDAEQAWRLRSRVTHGVGLPHPPNVEDPKVQAAEDELAVVDLYLKLEEVLRKTMERAIKDCAFAACFESEKSLDDWLEPER
ncbi:MAG: hypothetical protein JXQ75_22650 [Phycisphaerae bacterium]|nr:hypothetical protein [Phycisphaerae bacterium]